jgi:hypothetical protein
LYVLSPSSWAGSYLAWNLAVEADPGRMIRVYGEGGDATKQ